MKTFNFGIIGCGVISEWHASVVEEIEGAKLLGAFDQNTERIAAFCDSVLNLPMTVNPSLPSTDAAASFVTAALPSSETASKVTTFSFL